MHPTPQPELRRLGAVAAAFCQMCSMASADFRLLQPLPTKDVFFRRSLVAYKRRDLLWTLFLGIDLSFQETSHSLQPGDKGVTLAHNPRVLYPLRHLSSAAHHSRGTFLASNHRSPTRATAWHRAAGSQKGDREWQVTTWYLEPKWLRYTKHQIRVFLFSL
jgi:hypothetical protein